MRKSQIKQNAQGSLMYKKWQVAALMMLLKSLEIKAKTNL